MCKTVLAVGDPEEKARAVLGPPSHFCGETSHTLGGYWNSRWSDMFLMGQSDTTEEDFGNSLKSSLETDNCVLAVPLVQMGYTLTRRPPIPDFTLR